MTLAPFRTADRFLVLEYHRVPADGAPIFLPAALDCPAARFAEHVALLGRECSVLSLGDAWRRVSEGQPMPERPVVLTFDDCWGENVGTVAEVLAAAGLTATFFINAGDIGRTTLHPNHQFYYLLSVAGAERLRAALASLLPATAALPDLPAVSFAARRAMQDAIGAELASDRGRECMAALEERLQVPSSAQWAPRLYMSASQVRGLTSQRIEVGNHTMHHLSLPGLTASERHAEIADARARLRDLTGQDVGTFAYPYGHVDAACVREVYETGHRCACTVVRGYNDGGSDAFRLRRLEAASLTGPQLLESLSTYGARP